MQNELNIDNILTMEKLGTSAIGTSYKIDHKKYGICVLKLLDNKNKKFIFRFLKDLEKIKSLRHPRIARIYEISDPSEEHIYLIREWIPGVELQQIIYEKQKLPIEEVNNILLQMVSGVDALHREEVIHKNLKPNNVIINDKEVKLVDFSLPPTLAQYLSPEQCKGKKSGVHSDIYSIGCIYFYCASGRTLFVGSKSVEIMQAHVTEKIPDIRKYEPKLSKPLVDIFLKMVAKKSEHRPLNCHELFLAFRKITGSNMENVKGTRTETKDVEKKSPVFTSLPDTLETSTIQLIRVGNSWKAPDSEKPKQEPISPSLETSTIELIRSGNSWKTLGDNTSNVDQNSPLPELKSIDLSNLPISEDDSSTSNSFDAFSQNTYKSPLPKLQSFDEESGQTENEISYNTNFTDISKPDTDTQNQDNTGTVNNNTDTVNNQQSTNSSYLDNLQNWLLAQNNNLQIDKELDESSIFEMYKNGVNEIPADDMLMSSNQAQYDDNQPGFVISSNDEDENFANSDENENFAKEKTVSFHEMSSSTEQPLISDFERTKNDLKQFDSSSPEKTINLSAEDENDIESSSEPYAEFQTTKNQSGQFSPAFPEKTINLSEIDKDEDEEESTMYLHPDENEQLEEEVNYEPEKTVQYQYPQLASQETENTNQQESTGSEIRDRVRKLDMYNTQNIELHSTQNIETHSTKSIDMYNTQSIELSKSEEREFPYVDSMTKKHIRKFKDVTNNMAKKLKVVNQTLALLDNSGESEDVLFLDEMLKFITRKTGEILRADYTIIFLYDKEQHELFSMEKDEDTPFDLKIPADTGIVGEVVNKNEVVNISYDFYKDPRCEDRKKIDEQRDYRTYTMLVLPIHDNAGDLIAVVQLLNKLEAHIDPYAPLEERINKVGFTVEDIDMFYEFSQSMSLILESSNAFYRATKRQRAAASLISATRTLGQSLDLTATLDKVMDEAKNLLDADRITLWLLDKEKKELWANIKTPDGMQEIRIPSNAGYAGKVATTKEPLIIPFDIYEKENSETSKETDRKTGYRTCSMMCIPVFDKDKKLIGVTQAINKRRQGDFTPYNHQNWPAAPEMWKCSFNKSDMEFLSVFNDQAGVAIQNAALFDTVKRQEQMHRDILRSLSNGVISTDKLGKVAAANNSAIKLLGLKEEVELYKKDVSTLINIKDAHFKNWLDLALVAENNEEQYYPEQIIINANGDEHSINLSINPIVDITNNNSINGALVVIEDISHEKRMKNMMYRYMTQEVVEGLLSKGDIQLGGQLKHVTVLFSDIRSYTTLTEGLTAEEVVAMLNEYFEEMVEAVFKHRGTLDKYIGDAIMAVFGTPLQLEDHGWCAVQTALEMRKRLLKFNTKRESEGKAPLSIGIGIHSDEVVSGNIGSSKRMEFTSIGDGVNLASRLEGVSKQYGCDIIVSDTTLESCGGKVIARELDNIVVKGKTSSVKIYDLIGYTSDDIDANVLKVKELYEDARKSYLDGDFTLALEKFNKVIAIKPKDVASKLHIERCEHFISTPPEEWDGIWKMTSK